ncbi:MAG TPA: M3 family metallopeptidase, partial [Polyangium sp.]|nr:M3 family metallopeptidase [Polyangium sp.]
MRTRFSTVLSLALVFSACGGATPDPSTPTPQASASASATASVAKTDPAPTPAATSSEPDFNPVVLGLTPESVTKLCDERLGKAKQLVEQIKSLKGASPDKLTYAATLGRFDDVVLEIVNGGAFPYLMGMAHPDGATRAAAKECEPKVDTFQTSMWLDADLASVIKAYAAKNEKLEGEKAQLLADVLRDFRRNGLDLPADKQQRLRELNSAITKYGLEFMTNIGGDVGKIEIDAKDLAGLPKEFIASHAPNDKGKVTVTTDPPDYTPFITYAKNRKLALELYLKFINRGGIENVRVLEKLLELRAEKAKLLGYETWADYAVEPRMAKSKKTVQEFLDKLAKAIAEPAKADFEELRKEHVRLGGKATDKLYPPDRGYLEDRVRNARFSFNSQTLSEYLEIGAVTKGLLDVTAKMYDLEYRQVQPKTWHPDVTAYEVWSKGEKIGLFYLDLYARADKYKHFAMFPIRKAKRLSNGKWQTPIAALECNFPKPGAQPALMQHEELVTFFHEFGHVLHEMLTRSELARYSGSESKQDFVEVPSQMFEEWPWSREVLDLFARHHETKAKIPDDLFKAMTQARSFGRALHTQRQLVFATLDFQLHTRPVPVDSTKVTEEVQTKIDSFTFVKGGHTQSSFGHLVGYDAGYYSYQWALSLTRDVLTRFRKEGLMNTTTTDAWRNEVLSKGGGIDPVDLV